MLFCFSASVFRRNIIEYLMLCQRDLAQIKAAAGQAPLVGSTNCDPDAQHDNVLGAIFVADKSGLLTVANELDKPVVKGIEELEYAYGLLQLERKQRACKIRTELHSKCEVTVVQKPDAVKIVFCI